VHTATIVTATQAASSLSTPADEQRYEKREGDHAFELAFEVTEHGPGQGLGEKQKQEPSDATSDHLAERRLEVGLSGRDLPGDRALVEDADSAPLERRIEQVVDPDHTEELAVRIDDRKR
jgi:hypothetical protein